MKDLLRRVGGTLGLPLLCLGLMLALCRLSGASLFVGGPAGNVPGFFKSLCYFSLLCYAVSIQLHTGRMGFDTGAVIVLSTVLGFVSGIEAGDNLPLALAVAAAAGCLLHLLSCLLYIGLRLPMMIVSLGTTLLFEAAAYWIVRRFAYGGNVETLMLRRALTPAICAFSTDGVRMTAIALLVLLVMTLLFHYTRFGYDYRALQSGQRIAVQTGVPERRNALLCYAISGALLGVCGVVNYSFVSAVQPAINFGTVPIMFECFCPLFFGGFLNRFCNKQLGIFSGVVAYAIIQTGLGQIRIARNWNNYLIPLINAGILVIFMIYQTNSGTLRNFLRARRQRRAAEAV